ncbi:MAG: CotH kinase family protein [Planctomycetota bacterium]
MRIHHRRTAISLQIVALLVALTFSSELSAQVLINEVSASNCRTILDDEGDSSDWLECYNAGDTTIDLAGWTLSEGIKSPEDWTFPELSLPPGGFVLVWCSGEDEVRSVDKVVSLHASFSIRRSGETIRLLNPAGDEVDRVEVPEQDPDRSWGRFPDGSTAIGAFSYHLVPTPASPNDPRRSTQRLNAQIRFDPPGGRYSESVQVSISVDLPTPDIDLYYTSDGTDPTIESSRYESPIEVNETTFLRVTAFSKGDPIDLPVTHGYLFDERDLTLPVVSISLPVQTFRELHLDAVTRGPLSERAAYIEFLDDAGVRNHGTGFGMRLHGSAGRGGQYETKKSYKAFFRKAIGDGRLERPVIPSTSVERFDRLVLRGGFNDAFRSGPRASLIRDQLARDLQLDMGRISSHGSWYNLFVNGEYRGVYNVVERIDNDFLSSYFPEMGRDWDVIKGTGEALDGDREAFDSMESFFRSTDISSPEGFAAAQEIVDVENFTDYMILNLWAKTQDWPGKNRYIVRSRMEGGRWKFLCWDTEVSLGRNGGATTTSEFGLTDQLSTSTLVWNSLLENREYQGRFVTRFMELLSTVLSAEHARARVERLVSTIDPDMDQEMSLTQFTRNDWNSSLSDLRSFVRQRPAVVLDHLRNDFRLRVPRVVEANPSEVLIDSSHAQVQLLGDSFSEETSVTIGGVPAEVISQDRRSLTVRVERDPRLTESPLVVTVRNPDGSGSSSVGILSMEIVPSNGEFLRGDCDGDGNHTITDAVCGLNWLFRGGRQPGCLDAVDSNDSGGVDISDAVYLLNWLFLGGEAPPPPHPDCGPDPSEDKLECLDSGQCPGA